MKLPQWVEQAAEKTAREECHPASDQERTWYKVGFEFGAQAVLARAEKLERALLMVMSRTTDDPNHDPFTCNQPSCFFARDALAQWRSGE